MDWITSISGNTMRLIKEIIASVALLVFSSLPVMGGGEFQKNVVTERCGSLYGCSRCGDACGGTYRNPRGKGLERS